MEAPDQPKRAALRKTPQKVKKSAARPVGLEEEAYTQLEACAKKLKVSRQKYASAAIRYFTQNGLNPTIEQPKTLGHLEQVLSAKTLDAQNMAATVGNRLVAILRTWEKQLYEYLQAQQTATTNYLGQIETNLLSQQVQVENHVLSPLTEHVIRAEMEAYSTRVFVERTYLQVMEQPDTDWPKFNQSVSQERDQQVLIKLRELLAQRDAEKPKASAKPSPMESPVARKAAGKGEGQPTKT